MSAAIHHILRQMQRDARLAWLIGPGSRTYELLIEEAASANSLDPAELQRQHEASLKFEPWPTELKVEIDPQAILLLPHEETLVRWFGEENAYRSAHYYMQRMHDGPLPHHWWGYEIRTAALGFERWNSSPRYYVPDDFGTLVEVHP